MQIIKQHGWVYYVGDNAQTLERHKCGKWMYFFDNKEFVSEMCQKAINEDIVVESKHSEDNTGVACFYLNGDDLVCHKKVIEFFLENKLIRRTKTGRLYNIAFKFDDQTRAGEYGADFKAEIKLEQFIDLTTGEWMEK
jgi:hypothetical protein